MSAHGHSGEIRNPGPLHVSGGWKVLFALFTAVGIGAFLVALKMDKERAWASFLINHFFFLLLGAGGLFFAALQWLTNAMWSSPVRRLSESFTAYLPIAVLSSIGVILGAHELYHWAHTDAVANDSILLGKSGFLNLKFFTIRNIGIVILWTFFATKFVGRSVAQDQDGSFEHTRKNRSMAPLFMLFFALSLTLVAFDQIMSLDPHWFSTIFGIYCFAGLFSSTLAGMTILTVMLRKSGALGDVVNENHLHDLGKFLFAFTVFWAYIGFSQYMLIWYANLPEETIYFRKRALDDWRPIMGVLFLLRFIIPFFVLMPRQAKRNPKVLVGVSVLILVAHYFDLIWMVQPDFFETGPKIGWVELGMFLGFLGLFGLAVSRFLGRHNVVAIHDPRLNEAVFHHHQ